MKDMLNNDEASIVEKNLGVEISDSLVKSVITSIETYTNIMIKSVSPLKYERERKDNRPERAFFVVTFKIPFGTDVKSSPFWQSYTNKFAPEDGTPDTLDWKESSSPEDFQSVIGMSPTQIAREYGDKPFRVHVVKLNRDYEINDGVDIITTNKLTIVLLPGKDLTSVLRAKLQQNNVITKDATTSRRRSATQAERNAYIESKRAKKEDISTVAPAEESAPLNADVNAPF